MSVTSLVLGLLAETSLHPGSGRTTGAVDLPVAREANTGYPTIPGSSLKGALRDRAKQENWDNLEQIFGRPDGAGGVSITDARLLLLPVRSLTSHYRWVTCPYVLERLQRDLVLAGKQSSLPLASLNPVGKDQALGYRAERVFLEEWTFSVSKTDAVAQLAEAIKPLVKHQTVRERLAEQILVLHDDAFAYFASYGLAINARNVLDNNTKTSKNLWYEETLPADTLLYCLVLARPGQEAKLKRLKDAATGERSYLQVGGNETVGQGWCALAVLETQEVQL